MLLGWSCHQAINVVVYEDFRTSDWGFDDAGRLTYSAEWNMQINLGKHGSFMATRYIFLDEGGNLDFSPSGSRYYTITAVNMFRPFQLHTALDTYKYDLIEHSIEPRIQLEYFHCADDNRFIRARLFEMLAKHLPPGCVDTVVVEKPKTGPALQPPEEFYPRMLGYLLRFVLEKLPNNITEVVILTDTIPINKRRKAIEKALKITLKEMLPDKTPYSIMHHSSRADYGLQIADYLNWAIYRKYESNDTRAHKVVEHLIRSEFDIFQSGKKQYYHME